MTVNTGVTKYLLSEFGAVLALSAAITGYIFWRLRRQLPTDIGPSASNS